MRTFWKKTRQLITNGRLSSYFSNLIILRQFQNVRILREEIIIICLKREKTFKCWIRYILRMMISPDLGGKCSSVSKSARNEWELEVDSQSWKSCFTGMIRVPQNLVFLLGSATSSFEKLCIWRLTNLSSKTETIWRIYSI